MIHPYIYHEALAVKTPSEVLVTLMKYKENAVNPWFPGCMGPRDRDMVDIGCYRSCWIYCLSRSLRHSTVIFDEASMAEQMVMFHHFSIQVIWSCLVTIRLSDASSRGAGPWEDGATSTDDPDFRVSTTLILCLRRDARLLLRGLV